MFWYPVASWIAITLTYSLYSSYNLLKCGNSCTQGVQVVYQKLIIEILPLLDATLNVSLLPIKPISLLIQIFKICTRLS